MVDTASLNKIQDILAEIRKRLFLYYYSDYQNGPAREIEIISIVERPYSSIVFLLVELDKKPEKLVAKIIAENPLNSVVIQERNQSLVEFKILEMLYDKFISIKGCSVPRPVLCIPELNLYVTVFVRGPMLIDKMKYVKYLSSRQEFQDLKTRFYLCGRWLKYFQDFTGREEVGKEIVEGIIGRCLHRLKLIEEAQDPRCPGNLGQKVMDTLNSCVSNLNGKKIAVSGRHGDFHPLNIITDLEGVTVIDFLGYKKEPTVVDLLKMLMFLDDEMNSLSTSPKRIMELRKQFLNGYGHIDEVSDDLMIICETQHRIFSLACCVINKQDIWQHRIAQGRILKKHLEWLCSDKERKKDMLTLSVQGDL